jgi:hypothetical protein
MSIQTIYTFLGHTVFEWHTVQRLGSIYYMNLDILYTIYYMEPDDGQLGPKHVVLHVLHDEPVSEELCVKGGARRYTETETLKTHRDDTI